jgi:AcrR family transcriptional regulator
MQADTSVRDQIVATATRLFLSQGYNQTGINQIIEEAKVAKASLYYHFPSKEDLGVAYIKRRSESWYAGLNNYLKGVQEATERLIKVFEYRALFVQQNNFSGCSYTRIIAELPQRGTKIHNQAIANKEMQRKFFQDLVQQIASIAQEKKANLANTVFLLFDGATMQCQVYQETGPMELARAAVIELLAWSHRQ